MCESTRPSSGCIFTEALRTGFALLWVCYVLSLVLRCTDVFYTVSLMGSVFLMALHPYISKHESPQCVSCPLLNFQYRVLSNWLLASAVGPHLLVSSATLKFLTGEEEGRLRQLVLESEILQVACFLKASSGVLSLYLFDCEMYKSFFLSPKL